MTKTEKSGRRSTAAIEAAAVDANADARPARRRKLPRAEKAIENRNALLRAAAKVVGEVGYKEASIARITREAGLAHGTFYLYFDTRQDMLDAVLPFVGEELTLFIRQRVSGATSALDVEERSFRAAFEYLARNPGFYRTLNEAEFAAPAGFEKHFSSTAQRYLSSLKRSKDSGEFTEYSARELEVIAHMLMAVRFYLYLRFVKADGGDDGRLPEWVVQTYLKFLRNGLALEGPAAKKKNKGISKATGRRGAGP
jgi:AcrR family transcriptional regulator